MTTKDAIHFGPRLVASPAGTLRAASSKRPSSKLLNNEPLSNNGPQRLGASSMRPNNKLPNNETLNNNEWRKPRASSSDARRRPRKPQPPVITSRIVSPCVQPLMP